MVTSQTKYGRQDARFGEPSALESDDYDLNSMLADLGPQRLNELPLEGIRVSNNIAVPKPRSTGIGEDTLSKWTALYDPDVAEDLETEDLGTGDSYRNGPNFRPVPIRAGRSSLHTRRGSHGCNRIAPTVVPGRRGSVVGNRSSILPLTSAAIRRHLITQIQPNRNRPAIDQEWRGQSASLRAGGETTQPNQSTGLLGPRPTPRPTAIITAQSPFFTRHLKSGITSDPQRHDQTAANALIWNTSAASKQAHAGQIIPQGENTRPVLDGNSVNQAFSSQQNPFQKPPQHPPNLTLLSSKWTPQSPQVIANGSAHHIQDISTQTQDVPGPLLSKWAPVSKFSQLSPSPSHAVETGVKKQATPQFPDDATAQQAAKAVMPLPSRWAPEAAIERTSKRMLASPNPPGLPADNPSASQGMGSVATPPLAKSPAPQLAAKTTLSFPFPPPPSPSHQPYTVFSSSPYQWKAAVEANAANTQKITPAARDPILSTKSSMSSLHSHPIEARTRGRSPVPSLPISATPSRAPSAMSLHPTNVSAAGSRRPSPAPSQGHFNRTIAKPRTEHPPGLRPMPVSATNPWALNPALVANRSVPVSKQQLTMKEATTQSRSSSSSVTSQNRPNEQSNAQPPSRSASSAVKLPATEHTVNKKDPQSLGSRPAEKVKNKNKNKEVEAGLLADEQTRKQSSVPDTTPKTNISRPSPQEAAPDTTGDQEPLLPSQTLSDRLNARYPLATPRQINALARRFGTVCLGRLDGMTRRI